MSSAELSHRIAKAFHDGDATVDERDALISAVGPPEVQLFGDLPAPARDLLLNLETRGSAILGTRP